MASRNPAKGPSRRASATKTPPRWLVTPLHRRARGLVAVRRGPRRPRPAPGRPARAGPHRRGRARRPRRLPERGRALGKWDRHRARRLRGHRPVPAAAGARRLRSRAPRGRPARAPVAVGARRRHGRAGRARPAAPGPWSPRHRHYALGGGRRRRMAGRRRRRAVPPAHRAGRGGRPAPRRGPGRCPRRHACLPAAGRGRVRPRRARWRRSRLAEGKARAPGHVDAFELVGHRTSGHGGRRGSRRAGALRLRQRGRSGRRWTWAPAQGAASTRPLHPRRWADAAARDRPRARRATGSLEAAARVVPHAEQHAGAGPRRGAGAVGGCWSTRSPATGWRPSSSG